MQNQITEACACAGSLVLISLLTWGCSAASRPATPASALPTRYRIVVPDKADEATKAVVKDFAAILAQITGEKFPIVLDDTPPASVEIIVGHDNRRLTSLGLGGMTAGFVAGEYEIRTVGRRLIIAGAPPRGTINGLYGFLQDHLGCRWFTPGVSRIPRREALVLGDIRDRQKPAFRYRATICPGHWDPGWTVRNRLNACKAFSGAHVLTSDPRAATIGNYFNAHGFSYVPASLFDAHPEYFGMIDGKRVCAAESSKRTFCVTNDGLAAYMAGFLKDALRGRRPEHRLVGLGHADFSKPCQCPPCTAAAKEKDGVSGMYMQFYNKVAREVAKEFPDAIISVLAYGPTFNPPSFKMHPNIRATVAPIGMCHVHGYDEDRCNTDQWLIHKLEQWQRNCTQVQVWYYQHMVDSLLPSMNMRATQRDLRTFRRMGIQDTFIETASHPSCRDNPVPDGDGMLIEGYGNAKREGYFTVPFGLEHVKIYVGCRLMWNPDFNVQAGIREFCETYYGPAAAELIEYITMVESRDSYAKTVGHKKWQALPGIHQSGSFAPLLKWTSMQQMDRLFDLAEGKVADDKTLLRRVRMARLGLQQSILCFAPADNPLRKKAFDAFFSLTEELGVKVLYRTAATGKRMTLSQFKQVMSHPEKLPPPGELAPED